MPNYTMAMTSLDFATQSTANIGNVTVRFSTASETSTWLYISNSYRVGYTPPADLRELAQYTYTNTNKAIREGEYVAVSNGRGEFALLQIVDSQSNGHGGVRDGIIFKAASIVVSAPTVSLFSPLDGQDSVPVDSNVSLVFSEAIRRGSGDIVLKTADGAVVESFNAATSSNISISGNTLIIDPTRLLSPGVEYIVAFDAGTVKDLSGELYAGTSGYHFRTSSASAQAVSTVDLDFDVQRSLTIGGVVIDFSGRGSDSTYVYGGATYLVGAAAPTNLASLGQYAYSSDAKSVYENQYVAISNQRGNYALVRIIDARSDAHGSASDGVTFDVRFAAIGTGGNDTLDGGSVVAKMYGGGGSDVYRVDNAGDRVIETDSVSATGGIDQVDSYLSSYTLAANVENGRILISGQAALTGNSLNNVLYAGSGNSTINGGGGVDTLSYEYGVTGISGVVVDLSIATSQNTIGSGFDVLSNFENLSGSHYADRLTGNAGNNRIDGGVGNDTLDGLSGNDSMFGGGGNDLYYVRDAGDVIIESGATSGSNGVDAVLSFLRDYTLANNVENGEIAVSGVASLRGNSLNNILVAGGGDNTLNGGAGVDTASYARASGAVDVDLSVIGAQGTGASGRDVLISIENLTGSRFGDVLSGSAAGNVIDGGGGADSLFGGDGNDRLQGAGGNDTLEGGAGIDTLIGGDGDDAYVLRIAGDRVSEAINGGYDTIDSYLVAVTLDENIERGRILGGAAANMTGNSLNNELVSGSGNNVIDGGSGQDTVSYGRATNAVTVSLAASASQNTGASGVDRLISIENLIGSRFSDRLTGGSASNGLYGGDGDDTLTGGAGRDTLIGGNGKDVFDLNSVHESNVLGRERDVISDFTRGQDRIDLSTLDANALTVANDAFTSIVSASAGFSAPGQLMLFANVLYGNMDGDVAPEFSIALTGVSSLALSDFIV